jgi:hypothetical protein
MPHGSPPVSTYVAARPVTLACYPAEPRTMGSAQLPCSVLWARRTRCFHSQVCLALDVPQPQSQLKQSLTD